MYSCDPKLNINMKANLILPPYNQSPVNARPVAEYCFGGVPIRSFENLDRLLRCQPRGVNELLAPIDP